MKQEEVLTETLDEKTVLIEGDMSIEDMFYDDEESLDEAQRRAIEESSSGAKVEYWRIKGTGAFTIRFAPLAPAKPNTIKRKGYEFPVHSMWLRIIGDGGSDAKPIPAQVTRATECGFSVDVIDTYRALAIKAAKAKGDDKLAEKISGGTFGGGVRYDYKHVSYILDMEKRGEGFKLFEMSHSQFKKVDNEKLSMWKKLASKNAKAVCPISHFKDAYGVEIEKTKEKNKVDYAYRIDLINGFVPLTSEELQALFALPRVDEQIYRYSRYHHEAVQVFLKQYDDALGLGVFDDPAVQEAIETINSELPATDTSSFSLETPADSKITIETLYDEYDELEEAGLTDKSAEGQELRGKIREFIKEKGIEDEITINRSTTNIMILDEIVDVLSSIEADGGDGEPADTKEPEIEEEEQEIEEEEEEAPTRTRRARRTRQ